METYDAVELVVHPFHSILREDLYDNSGKLWSVKGLRTEDYLRHAFRLYQRIARKIDAGTPVIAVYDPDDLERAQTFFGEYVEDVADWVPTRPRYGDLEPVGEKKMEALISQVSEGGRIDVSGELAGLCYETVYEDVCDRVDESGKDIAVREGQVFPHKPLKNENYQPYWADEHVITPRGMF